MNIRFVRFELPLGVYGVYVVAELRCQVVAYQFRVGVVDLLLHLYDLGVLPQLFLSEEVPDR